jgi:transposase
MSIVESTGKKKPRPRRSFTPEFKAEIVELCRRGDRSVRKVAEYFDLSLALSGILTFSYL